MNVVIDVMLTWQKAPQILRVSTRDDVALAVGVKLDTSMARQEFHNVIQNPFITVEMDASVAIEDFIDMEVWLVCNGDIVPLPFPDAEDETLDYAGTITHLDKTYHVYTYIDYEQ